MKKFRIGEASLRRWVGQSRDIDDLRPKKQRGGTPSVISVKELDAILDRHPDANAGGRVFADVLF
jgi:transposase